MDLEQAASGSLLDRRALLAGSLGLAATLVTGCSADRTSARPAAGPAPRPPARTAPRTAPVAPATPAAPAAPAAGGAAARAARATVPVLCWHQLREWRPGDSAYARRLLVCPPGRFRRQLDALAEDGWSAIGPDDYLAHLRTGAPLPAKPVLLSFDDSQGSQATEALPQLRSRGLTGTFFCMTVVLDKQGWLSRDDVRRLAGAGMTVGAHSHDHSRADRWSGGDWATQLEAPRELLEGVVRRPVEHFAYPYGAWAPGGFRHLAAAGYATAFQLSDDALDRTAPQLTLRRVLVDSTWRTADLLRQVRQPV